MSKRHRRRDDNLSSGGGTKLNGALPAGTVGRQAVTSGFGAAARRDAAGPRDDAMKDEALAAAVEPEPFVLGGFLSEPGQMNEPVRVLAVVKTHARRITVNGHPVHRHAATGKTGPGVYSAVWSRTVRRFGRLCVWFIPAAALCFGVVGWLGPPDGSLAAEGSSVARWTWFGTALVGLVFALIGAVALAGLLAAARGRRWALAAVLAMVPGTVAVAATAGVVVWAGPGAVAAPFEVSLSGFGSGSTGEPLPAVVLGWLVTAGVTLLGLGWFALGLAVRSSRVLNRSDGMLLIFAAVAGALGAYPPLRFLLGIGALLLLAAGLGLSWTASRLTPAARDDHHRAGHSGKAQHIAAG